MKKVNKPQAPEKTSEGDFPTFVVIDEVSTVTPEMWATAAQSDSQAPSSLAACQSSDDLARYLHTLGWRGILDQEWTNLSLLWEEIKELRS